MSNRLHDLIFGLVANQKASTPRVEANTRLIWPGGTPGPGSQTAMTGHSWGATRQVVSHAGPVGGKRPPSSTVSVVVASFARKDILERTLDSFFQFNTYPIKELVVIQCREFAKQTSLVQKYQRYHLRWTTTHIEAPAAYLHAISHSEMTTTPAYVFYCTDNCEFTRSGFIEKLLWFFQHNDELAQVLLPERSQSDNYSYWDHLFYAGSVPYRLVSDNADTEIVRSFCLEPGLRRLEAYSRLVSVGSLKRGSSRENFDAEAADARNASSQAMLTAIPVDDECKGYIRRVAP